MAKFNIQTKGTNEYEVEADDFTIADGYFVFTSGQSYDKVYAIQADVVSRVERLGA